MAEEPMDGSAGCAAGERTFIILKTYDGVIEIEAFPEAAPEAVGQLLRLLEGPIYRDEVVAEGPDRPTVGYFDGTYIDHSLRGIEVGTEIRSPANGILIRAQIDATALGLEDRRIESSARAMEVWQQEIFRYDTTIHGRKERPGKLAEWMAEWQETMSPDFLLGATQKEINEAIGYRYESGLPSRPVRRGAVGLRPISKEWSTPALIIALSDRPQLDGRRMIIGNVSSGLELVEKMSRRRLTPTKSDSTRPLVPVRITDGHLECRSASEADVPNKKEES